MTISNFKAWLSGFSEAIDGAPTPEQWHKIKSQLGQVQDDEPVTVSVPWWIPSYTYTHSPPVRIVPLTVGDPWDVTPVITCSNMANTISGEPVSLVNVAH